MHWLLHEAMTAVMSDEAAAWLFLVADLLTLLTIPSVLLARRGRPLAALSWLLALLALPLLGVLAWWVLGRTHLHRLCRRRQRAVRELCACDDEMEPADAVDSRFGYLAGGGARGRERTGVFAPSVGNRLSILEDGVEAFPELALLLTGARQEICALFYTWQDDATGRRIRDLLVRRACDGLRVRVIVDAVGSLGTRAAFWRPLREAGGAVVSFLPFRFGLGRPAINFRNHRKLLVVDQARALFGGLNLGEAYESEWHDLAFLCSGPVVTSLQAVFDEDWLFATGAHARSLAMSEPTCPPTPEGTAGTCTLIASGPDRPDGRVLDAVLHVLSTARRRIWLTTPYFIPGPAVQAALRGAVLRGVDVRLLIPGPCDVPLVSWASRAFLAPLQHAGARAFRYEGRVLHAKSLVVDDDLAFVGSANVDQRSFKLNFELTCLVESEEFTARLAALFERDLLDSVEMAREDLEPNGRWPRLLQSAAQLFGPLL